MIALTMAIVVGWIALSPRAYAKDWSLTARGTVVVAEGTAFAPVGGARVKRMDANDSFDAEMGRGVTDGNGRFEIVGVGGDPLFPWDSQTASKPDVYVRVELVSGSVVVQNVSGHLPSIVTSVRSDTAGAIDFGTVLFGPADRVIPARLFVRAQRQADQYARTVGGKLPLTDGRLRIFYPSVTVERPFSDTTNVWVLRRIRGRGAGLT